MNKVQIFSVVLCMVAAIGLATIPSTFARPAEAFEQLRLRASAWFKTTDQKSRRKEMRAMTRALKQPCKYCHTLGFKGYTDRHKVSLEMMVLSAENGVECKDCHLGKKALSPMGKVAKGMQIIAQKEGATWLDCHNPKARFKSLTPRGEQYKHTYPDLLMNMGIQEHIEK